PEEVPLDAEPRDVFDLAELAVPREGVRECGAAHPLELLEPERGLRRLDHLGDAGVEPAQVERLRHARTRRRAPFSEPDEVVRAPGLRARADRRALPPAERLALHDRARDAAVDVEVARFDVLE